MRRILITRARLRGLAGVALLVAVSASVTASASASSSASEGGSGGGPGKPREAAALTGSAKLYRSLGDDITFTFDAHLAARDRMDPSKATGTFRFSHYLNGDGAWAEGTIDCLVTGGKVAVASGVITSTDLPGAKGIRVGFTVHDRGRHDRLGYSWAAVGSPVETKDLPKCVGSAPFEKVRYRTGDYRVLPWQPDH